MKQKPSGIERGMEWVSSHTWQMKHQVWMYNIADNMNLIRGGKDIRDLPKCSGSALVVGAGPSLERYNQLRMIKESGGYEEGSAIIACDKALVPCLREGIVPHVVMSADADVAVREFYSHELVLRNEKTKAVLNIITSPDVVQAVPYDKFWYMTPYDDPLSQYSITRCIHFMTGGKTILSSFGCVGGEAVNLAMFLNANSVIMVGMDYGYPPDMPLEKTSYYQSYKWLAEKRGKKLEQFFTKVRNPDTGEEVILDMNWATYRRLFTEQIRRAKVKIINCSPISSLFGENIEFMPLEKALEKFK